MRVLLWGLGLLVALPMAQALASEPAQPDYQALRPDAWFSSDAEGNETRKVGLGWDWQRTDLEHWVGLKVEHARFSGDGWSENEQRVYLRAAGGPEQWRWQAAVGSNGHDLIGNASWFTTDDFRKELFIEREVLETEEGVRRNLVQTYAGAAIDIPFNDRWSATVLGGLQDFGSGDNLRTHARVNLSFLAFPEQGVSVQLRNRYYRNSDPFEGSYYSPDWYRESLGVLAWRRHINGYHLRAAAGWGRQKSAGDDSKRARMIEVWMETPRWKRSWLRAYAGYTDTPVLTNTGRGSYAYRYFNIEAVVAF
jgi:hypothetical protein